MFLRNAFTSGSALSTRKSEANGCERLAKSSRLRLSLTGFPRHLPGSYQFATASVLLSQHDRDHTLGDRGIGWIRRVIRQGLVEIIDLEKYPVTVGIERTEVVFFVRVVGVAEIIVYGDRFDDALDGFLPERRNARCDDCEAAKQMLAKFVVESTNFIGLGGHDGISVVGVTC